MGPPSGFYKAPCTKAILGLTSLGSITASMFEMRYAGFLDLDLQAVRRFQLQRVVSSQLVFASSGEVILGLLLLYQFRQFERRIGSSKFSAFVLASTVISMSTQLALLVLFPEAMSHLPSGPYSVIFSLFVHFFAHVPKLKRYSVLGIELSDKSWTYLLGSQLLLNRGWASFGVGVCGFLSGLVCQTDLLPLSAMRFPRWLERLCERYVLPLMRSTSPAEAAANARAARERRLQQQQQRRRQPPHRQQFGVNGHSQLLGNALNAAQMPFGAAALAPEAPNEEAVATLMALGFARDNVVQALRACNNNVDRAADYLLNSAS